MPDLTHAHGVWVLLTVSVAAGALWARDAMLVPALLAGTAHVGAFLAVAGALGPLPGARAWSRGASLALVTALLALALGARPTFLVFSMISLAPTLGAIFAARRLGPLSLPTISLGSLAIALAAPASACAGGAEPLRAALLALLLAPFFAWRTHRIVVRFRRASGERRQSLRAWGLREAGLTAAWSLALAFLGAE